MPIGNVSILQKKQDLLFGKGILHIYGMGRPGQESKLTAQGSALMREIFFRAQLDFISSAGKHVLYVPNA